MAYDVDVIVIGSGAGGGTFAHACARAGKRVLVLERGRALAATAHDERAVLIDKQPYDDRPVLVDGVPRRLYMGGVLGGSTALFGAALLRPAPADFTPGQHYGERLPRHLWEWPIGYGDLAPHYDEAERLYGVVADGAADLGPLPRPARIAPQEVLPMHPINQRLIEANRKGGLAPFRLPLGIDFQRCLQCGSCPGFPCPNGSRSSSRRLLDAADGGLRVETGQEVVRLLHDGRQATGVEVVDRSSGERRVLRARRYVLAAGAIGSPAILLRSGAGGSQVGRHYMMHQSPIVIGVFARAHGAERAFVKQVGFTDYYFGAPDYPHKLGLVQSLPVPGPLMIGKTAPVPLPRVLIDVLRRRMLPLVGIVEDLPDPDNRVTLTADGSLALHHRFSPYDLERGARLAALIRGILKRAGARFCLAKAFPSSEHVAHQCGTLRFGRDPAHAVADRDGRLFDLEDVFVADGSLFPTSLGVGPALTIMANALRIAGVVSREL